MTPTHTPSTRAEASAPDHGITFGEALRVWVKVALNSFGGPAGQIAVMHRMLVEEKRWISERRFLHALNYCMLLPGPEAQQLATYIGWLLHRTAGGLTAGLLFILPGFLSILALSYLYAGWQDVGFVEGLFFGLKPAVLAVVIEAVQRIGKRALKGPFMVALAGAAFVGIYFFTLPFPLIIVGAAGAGFLAGRLHPPLMPTGGGHGPSSGGRGGEAPARLADDAAPHTQPTAGRALRVASIFLVLWMGPIALLLAGPGSEHVFTREAIFFSKAATVTFGGAYSVLAYIGQQAVETYGWLRPEEMLDGLGMAETTPGPLIQVVQFVGFMGAYRNPGELHPMVAATFGAVLTTWVTFVPCFLWIFLGAPYVEALRNARALNHMLTAITASVVGVILNLAIWFGLHTVFMEVAEKRWGPFRFLVPAWSTIDVAALLIAVAAVVAIFRLKLGMMKTLGAAAAVGAVIHLIRGS